MHFNHGADFGDKGYKQFRSRYNLPYTEAAYISKEPYSLDKRKQKLFGTYEAINGSRIKRGAADADCIILNHYISIGEV
jgi:hypothetical protein